MAPKPLDILKNGLDKFSKKIKTRKEALTLKLSWRESISSADEKWLDQEVNTMKAIEARANIEINGGDDINDGIPTDPHPTHHDALKASSTIRRYIEDLNDPIAWKMEALLASFNMKIHVDESRALKHTLLTDFFQRS